MLQTIERPDWVGERMLGLSILVGMAVAGTILWLGSIAYYIGAGIGWGNLAALAPTELFSVAATALAPVAGLWLTIAFIGSSLSLVQQNKTIRQFLWQARRSADHTEIVARSLLEMQNQAARSVFFDKLDHLIGDLNAAICDIAETAGMLDADQAAQTWARTANGDRWLFARLFTDAELRGERVTEQLGRMAAEDQNLRQAVFNFFRRYDHLMAQLKKHDTDGLLTESIEECPVGKLHILMSRTSHFRAEALMSQSLHHDPEPLVEVPEDDGEPIVVEDPTPYAADHEAHPMATQPATITTMPPAPEPSAPPTVPSSATTAPATTTAPASTTTLPASITAPPDGEPEPEPAPDTAVEPEHETAHDTPHETGHETVDADAPDEPPADDTPVEPPRSVPLRAQPTPPKAPETPEPPSEHEPEQESETAPSKHDSRQTDLFADPGSVGRAFSPLTPGFPDDEGPMEQDKPSAPPSDDKT